MVAFTTIAAAAALVIGAAEAHVSPWHPSIFGFDYPNQSDYPTYQKAGAQQNNNRPVTPIRLSSSNRDESFWLGNGLRNYPPAPGQFFNINSGGSSMLELSCNRAYTSYGRGERLKYACNSPYTLHTVNWFNTEPDLNKLGGTAIAIAYTSDAKNVKSSDFTVVSVNYRSVWEREAHYSFPAGMPECPPEGCLCTWNWVHTAGNWRNPPAPGSDPQGEGYGFEIFNTLMRCKVTGAVNNGNKVGAGQNPGPNVSGPKKPIINWMSSGNTVNPENKTNFGFATYSTKWGFRDGAQTDAIQRK